MISLQFKNKKRILVVDDDPLIRESIPKILDKKGYFVDSAVSGREAIKKAESAEFDLVLLDLVMPDMDGINVLTELRVINPKTKVVMISGFATVESAVEAIKKGASDYLTKPYTTDRLLATIGRVLEEKSFEDNLRKMNLESTLFSLANPLRRSAMMLLSVKPELHFTEMVKRLDIDEQTKLAYHLKTLKDSGLIEQDENGGYYLTKEGKQALEYLRILGSFFSVQES